MLIIAHTNWVTATIAVIITVLLWLIGQEYAGAIAAENMSNVTEVRP